MVLVIGCICYLCEAILNENNEKKTGPLDCDIDPAGVFPNVVGTPATQLDFQGAAGSCFAA